MGDEAGNQGDDLLIVQGKSDVLGVAKGPIQNFGFFHGPPAGQCLRNGFPICNALIGGIKKFPIAATTSLKSGAWPGILIFLRNAFHCFCFSGSSENSLVKGGGA